MSPTIALVSDRVGWHCRQLMTAFETLAAHVVVVDPHQCRIDSDGPAGLMLPGFENALPDAVLVRAIPAGSFEQVTLRLGVLHALERCGVRVINSAGAIERTVDKSAAAALLHQHYLPTPPSLTTDQAVHAENWLAREAAAGYSTVIKPLFGAEGKGLILLAPGDRLADVSSLDGFGAVWHLQRFIPSSLTGGARDIRLLVLGGQVLCAMQREQADSWITNVARGGRCTALLPTPTQCELAVAAAGAVGAELAGVDLVVDLDGRSWLLEVNSVPAWSGLQSVSERSIAEAIASHLVLQVSK